MSSLLLTIAIGIFASLLIWTISDWVFRHYGSWGPLPMIVIGTVVVASLSALSGYMYSKSVSKRLEEEGGEAFDFFSSSSSQSPGPSIIYLGH